MKKLGLAALIIFLTTISFSQHNKENEMSKKEKIEQLKIGFITNELNLTKEESEKFWPVYNEMSEKLIQERKLQRKLIKEIKSDFEYISESECKKKLNAIHLSEIKEAELKLEFNEEIAEIIGYKKAAKLLSLEQRFKRELLNKIEKRNQADNSTK